MRRKTRRQKVRERQESKSPVVMAHKSECGLSSSCQMSLGESDFVDNMMIYVQETVISTKNMQQQCEIPSFIVNFELF